MPSNKHNYLAILRRNIWARLKELDRRPAWLAARSGVKPPNLSKLLNEKFEENPTLETIVGLSGALNREPGVLLLSEEAGRLLDAYGKASPRAREQALMVLSLPEDVFSVPHSEKESSSLAPNQDSQPKPKLGPEQAKSIVQGLLVRLAELGPETLPPKLDPAEIKKVVE